jgi:hypothetical protein
VPVLASPASNALLTDYTPRLDWGSSSLSPDHYEIWVHGNSTFTDMVYEEDVVASEFTPPTDLTPNRTYWWKARAYNVGGQYSPWSAVRTFRTVIATPVLSAPVEGEVVTMLKPTFTWSNVEATSYTLQVSTNNLFTTFVINVNPTTTFFTPTTNLPTQKVLEVRVRANGPNGPSAWSEVVSFIIVP